MREWLVISALGGLSLALVYWALRARTFATGSPDRAPASAGHGGAPATTSDRTLAVLEFEGEPGRVPVTRQEVVIGRHSEDDVQVRDVRVSRHHARLIARRDGAFEIHNLTAVRSEPNPMTVNGEQRDHAELAEGDTISLGGVTFTLRRGAA